MIPKKIHYCWFGGKPIPNNLKKYIKSWKKKCPDYEIIRWDESNFDIRCSKFLSDAYDAKAWAFVSDYARLKIIYDNGGIYLDTDVEVLKSFDTLLINDCYFAEQQTDNVVASGLGFGSVKGHKILKEMLDEYDSTVFDINKKMELACPHLNTRTLTKHGFKYSNKITSMKNINVVIYPPKYFDPLAPGNTETLLCDDTYSIHHYSATWMKNSIVIRRKIINLIGLKNINRIKKILKR